MVAVDRYFKVVHPHPMVNAISNRTAAATACVLWTLVILGTVYLLIESHLCVQGTLSSCESFIMESANGWHDVMFQLEFFLPQFPELCMEMLFIIAAISAQGP